LKKVYLKQLIEEMRAIIRTIESQIRILESYLPECDT